MIMEEELCIVHVVVEELLKLLVDKVDGDLLEAVVLKDLKTGDVKHSTEVGLFLRKMSDKQVGWNSIWTWPLYRRVDPV